MPVRKIRGHDLNPVSCPGCQKEGAVPVGTYLCSDCGTWFEVTDE